MDEETRRSIENLKKEIEDLKDEVSKLSDNLGNHRHDSDGVSSHNY